MANVLIVEDEQRLRRTLAISLGARGFQVTEAATGADAIAALAAAPPDLVVLDLGLPDMDGLAVISHLRATSQTPVIVLSARHAQSEKVDALEAGADDFVTKPFGLEELVARIRVALRRTQGPAPLQTIVTASFTLDFAGMAATTASGEPVRLTPTEWKLARALAQQAGSVVPGQQLLREVWGPAFLKQTHYLRVYLAHLRKKLEPEPERPQHFITVPGVGYRFQG